MPAWTQLFAEHYMVRFLLENSLGAWWANHHPDSPLLAEGSEPRVWPRGVGGPGGPMKGKPIGEELKMLFRARQ